MFIVLDIIIIKYEFLKSHRLLNKIEVFIFIIKILLQLHHVVSLSDDHQELQAEVPGQGSLG